MLMLSKAGKNVKCPINPFLLTLDPPKLLSSVSEHFDRSNIWFPGNSDLPKLKMLESRVPKQISSLV